MKAAIQFTNIGEVLAGIKKREEKLKNIPKVARQMGILAANEMHQLTHKQSSNWDNTIHPVVTKKKSFVYELWVGSKGAFTDGKTYGNPPDNVKLGYNYGARQERLYHPIEIGWNRAQPDMKDRWMKVMHGIILGTMHTTSLNDTVSSSSTFGENMGDQFSMMAGF